MFKTIIIIALTMLSSGMALELTRPGILENDSLLNLREMANTTSRKARTLREGMGLIEVEKTLNGEGREQRMIRSIKPDTADPLDWNVGWEIARTYEAEENGSHQSITAVFQAWTDDRAKGRPPASAFRLVRWN